MATVDKHRLSDGFLSLEAGCDQGKAPNLIARNNDAFAVNTSHRGGWPTPRPGFRKRTINFNSDAAVQTAFEDSLFQVAGGYTADNGNGSLISMHGGRVFRFNLTDYSLQEISIPGDYNNAGLPLAWWCKAENFFIIQDDSSRPFIYNGGSARRATNTEIPVGRQMAYYMGRIWIAKGREYVAGDIVFGPSGTASLGYRDSILKMTENTFLAEGGAFAVPTDAGDIVALKPIANVNTALGQGELIAFTHESVFATSVPQDRTTWKNTSQPLQRMIQLANGAYAQDYVVNVNEDLFYRSPDGIRSLAFSVRNAGEWGNTPISNEVSEIIGFDSDAFLQYGSGCNFDNREIGTCSPAYCQGHGVYHRGLAVLDFDLITGMLGKSPPAWEGIWTGLNFLKVLTVKHQNVTRCFTYVLNASAKIEIWEITKSDLADNDGTQDIPIEWRVDARSMDFGSKFDRKKLFSADLFIDRVSGNYAIDLDYVPDSNPCPVDWDSWSGCAKTQLCVEDIVRCEALPNFQPQYRPMLQALQPADTFDPILNRLNRVGYEFQPVFNNRGYFRLKQFRMNAYEDQQPPYGDSPVVAGCPTKQCCKINPFAYSANGGEPSP